MPGSRVLAISPRKAVAAIGLFALLAVSLPVNGYFLFGNAPPHLDVPRSASAVVAGAMSAAVTENYNQNFLLRDTGIDLFGTLSWVLFHEGRKGVLAGKDGWLFSSEEFDTSPQSAERVAKAVAFVGMVQAKLAASGTQMVVALVPTKASIYPEELGGYRLPGEPAARYDRLLADLAKAGVDTPDLRPVLRAAKSQGEAYLHTDTHWTSLGATAVANALALHLAGRDLGDEKAFTRRDLPIASHSGDLLRYVRVASFARPLAPAPDRLMTYEAVAGDGGSLLGDDAIPVALVGTSYSANAKWSFEAALKIALARDVMNVAAEGKGPFQPISEYLRGDAFKASPPKLVIWEIPERFVDDPYDAAAFQID